MSPEPLFQLALTQHRNGQRGQSESTARQVMQLDPQFHQAYFLLAGLLLERREPVEATDLLAKAVALSPNTPEYHNALGTALSTQARFEEAAAAYRHAI